MSRSTQIRVAWLLLPAALVWIGLAALARLAGTRGAPDQDQLAERLAAAAQTLWEDARRVAQTALVGSPWRAAELRLAEGLDTRLEGVGVLDSGGSYLNWQGRPVEPEPPLLDPRGPEWTIRRDGVKTRLVVRAGPNEFGFLTLATFVVDSRVGGEPFETLLGPALPGSISLEVLFLDTAALYGESLLDPVARGRLDPSRVSPATDDGTPYVLLRSPGGDLLARARIHSQSADHRARELRRAGRGWAAALFVLGLGLAFPWNRAVRRTGGLLAAFAAVLLGRAALIAGGTAGLLPREIGSPSVYGSSAPFGILGSPLALLFTCGALYLLCQALRRYTVALSAARRGTAALLAGGGAALSTAALWTLTVSLARDSGQPVLRLEGLSAPGPAILLVGWVLAILGAAELWATLVMCLRRRAAAPARPERVLVGLAVLALALLASTTFGAVDDDLALRRLRQEFAPQVLEQSAHRRVALASAVRHAAETLAEPRPDPLRGEPTAFDLWVGSDLFHEGYKSSIELYSLAGARIDRFGFDLPPQLEAAPSIDVLAAEPRVVEESFPVGAIFQRTLHAETAVLRDGAPLGAVVGHVLDEPSNLSFLPDAEPYLAALGSGAAMQGRGQTLSSPAYVLYDRRGTVLHRTLDRPPSLTREMEIAATLERTVDVTVGEESYVALPLLDGANLHLLLLRSRTLLEGTGAFVRLGLLALLLLVALTLVTDAFRRRGLGRLVQALRGSFYRKLLATLIVASLVPLVGLSLFVRGYIESRSDAALESAAVQYVLVGQRVVEDFLATEYDRGEEPPRLNDPILHWLRRLVEQEIHVYREGRLEASSKRELFDSGLLPARLPGDVQEELVRGGLPYLVTPTRLGRVSIPVAYAPMRSPGSSTGRVIAVPLSLTSSELERTVDRLAEVLLLATVAIAGVLAAVAAVVARNVARPVRELVGVTGRIASGDYRARLVARTRDEIAELVESFNAMARSLAAQRADLERRRDYMEALLRNATAGVVSTDSVGRIVTVNPAMARLLGLPPTALRPGERLADAVSRHAELLPLGRRLSRPDRLAEPIEIDLHREGRARRFRLVRADLPDPRGGAPGSLFLMDDVTDLMRSNQLAAWAEMARAIAHEIKNPLTPIQLSTEHLRRLLRDRGLLPSAELESCLETVMKQVRALRAIATEFSAYAKVPALALEARDPVEFLREVVAPYRAGSPPGLRIEERYEPSPPVDIDERVLGRAIVNLVENALQAMPDGGTLIVSVRPDPEDAKGVELAVEDTGTGLEDEVRARLFEPYFSTKSSGTGLGLAIVQRAVEAHRGKLAVDSEAGRGTRFRIRLPAARASDASTPPEAARTPGAREEA